MDRQENENRIEQFTERNDIQRGQNGTRDICPGITICFYKKLLGSTGSFLLSLKKWHQIRSKYR